MPISTLRRWRWIAVTLIVSAIPFLLLAAAPEAGRPRLAVLVVFDQLRGDYLTRWDELFEEGGFHRLEKEGAWFQNCHYNYANTFTGAGHASLATGCSPDKHGIVGNEWYEPANKSYAYCAASGRYEQVPAVPGIELARAELGISPERLLAPTLGEALKQATQGKGRVVSLSLKDAAAVMLGGRKPDACYWLDMSSGAFITSTYYRDRLHPWLAEFNKAGVADRWFGKEWTRLRPKLDYVKHSGPDDVEGEGIGVGQGRTFPHPFDGGLGKNKLAYYSQLYNSPQGNELLLELAKRAIEAEKLGKGDVPDLLCLSFSSNDAVGHSWGPDSQEVLDTTLRSDLIVKELLDWLDAKVGKGRYVLALTADHGVCPLPEVSQKQGKEAARLSTFSIAGKTENFLRENFGAKNDIETQWVEVFAYPWLYLNQAAITKYKLKPAEVEASLVRWIGKQGGVEAAYGRAQLTKGVPAEDVLGEKVRRSFQPDRCGDVAVVFKPYHIVYSRFSGTTHGTPHSYDTHVPLLIYGPGVRSGVRREAIVPQAAAAILARSIGIEPPGKADAVVPAGLFEK
jgi:hypothetical protein